MSCSNCYNGCAQITSDQCVKYTGIDVPVLGIKNGDSLSYVEQAIITFLTSTLDGTGIKIKIDQSVICQIVKKYLPTCGDLTVVDFTKALTQAVCELKTSIEGNTTEITTINNFIDDLEAAYDLSDCLSDVEPAVTPTSGTHDILQAVITRLCAFIRDVNATFVKINDVEEIVETIISENPVSTKYYSRMIPFVAVPFFPTDAILANFNSGVGQGDWEQIYFCNGTNGTPDLRGRVPVGATDGTMLGGLLPTQTNPAEPGGFNPTYVKGTPLGNNSITLSEPQMPRHEHNTTVTVSGSIPNHTHIVAGGGSNDRTSPSSTEIISNEIAAGGNSSYKFGRTLSHSSGVTSANGGGPLSLTVNVTNPQKGGNEAHSNVQPGMGCYYIMHIPL